MSLREVWVAGTDVVWLLWKAGSSYQCFAADTGAQKEKYQGMKKQTRGFPRASSRLEVKQKLSRRFPSRLRGVEIALLLQCAHRVSHNCGVAECSLPDSVGCALITVCNQGNSLVQ